MGASVCALGLLIWACLGLVAPVPLRLFYPYGSSRGDETLSNEDDISSPEVQLTTPIHYYDGFYTSIYVNSNGHVTFESELPVIQPNMVLPMGREFRLIAAFFADVDLTQGGNVFYRETNEEALLQRAGADVQGHFSQFPDFEPLGLFIATWDKVLPHKPESALTNTFQIVIASDELNSFVIFNYLDEGVMWTKSVGKWAEYNRPDPPAQAGFDSGSSLSYTLPKSGEPQVTRLASASNVNVPGVWMFHVGNTKGSNVGGPDLNTGDVVIYQPELDQGTCAGGGSQECHEDAMCDDHETGYCCHCVPPSYGNGQHCIQPTAPQRLNGKISGQINGTELGNLDMHTFVVTTDGRAYTAFSRIPEELSTPLMTLNTIGGVIGWIFALRGGPGAKNGYMYTGGNMNRTARITYRDGGEVTINQRFLGHNVLNSIRLETSISGTVPTLPKADRITVDDYNEEYRRVGRGRIQSTSERTFRVNEIAHRYTWDQTITYEECEHAPVDAEGNYMRLGVTRNFINYDPQERVVRHASSNKVALMSGADPCQEGAKSCDQNAECIPEADTFRCKCRTGFLGDGFSCQDLDECTILSACDQNAVCTNVPGSFRCQCVYGFTGDGRTCTREVQLCGDAICDDNARCVFNDVENKPMCECKTGYRMDGDSCRAISFDCSELDICGDNAECVYSETEGGYVCECVEGFSGDGLDCGSTVIATGCEDCDINARCVTDVDSLTYRCQCREGYRGTGYTCTREYIECLFDQSAQAYQCVCQAGYRGDGTYCSAYDCRESDICHVNAACAQNTDGQYLCVCNPGYSGDGRRCEAAGCNVLNDCDVNARCGPDPRDTRRYICRCNAGYTGDGKACIRRVVPCNEVNKCSEDGQCLYDPSVEGYQCRCNRGFEGDGFTCRSRGVDCQRRPGLCNENADCILNLDAFMCVCRLGFRGDGNSCEPVRNENNYLLFSRGYSIHKVPYYQNGDVSDGSRVLYLPDELAVGVATDCLDGKFYWTDVSRGQISRADIDGFNKERVMDGFSSPEGIAVDFVGRTLYVTDSGLDVVAVVNINGTYRKTLISDNMRDPRGIVVDPHRGVMYWADWFRNAPTIERANMDGSDRAQFVTTDLGLPNGLTLDTYTQQLCWADAGVKKIECVRTDGIGRRVVTEEAQYPFDITFYGNMLYYSDWTVDGISSVDVNSGEAGDVLTLPVGGNGRLYGLTSIGEFCPRITNACFRNNGGCRYLCLPTPNGGRTCACPDDVDELTCAEIGIVTKRKK
ncbi:NDG-like protein [Mya arenaria]|uniref:NDG-like protein n=1 Tax=Mya arenaria TaxID=6604 RepID=A0ABY7FA58_MYAAR|nr:NDG-like protein [Mya arenaria]